MDENGPFTDGLPIKNGGFSHGYVSHNQMVSFVVSMEKEPAIDHICKLRRGRIVETWNIWSTPPGQSIKFDLETTG